MHTFRKTSSLYTQVSQSQTHNDMRLIEKLLKSPIDNLELGNPQTSPVRRTSFTEGSKEAKRVILINSIIHTASTFLAFMELKSIKDIRNTGFGAGPNAGLGISLTLLLAVWVAAGALNKMANYYKYISRATGEYDYDWLTKETRIEAGKLSLFYDTNIGTTPKLHYLTLVQKKKDIHVEIASLAEIENELKRELLDNKFTLTVESSKKLKTLIARYPDHLPKLNADTPFVPTENALPDYWFFPLCCISQLPSTSAGFLLGYLMMNSIGVGIFTALINWMINIINTMPAIANQYAKEHRMGRIEDQPFTSIILNSIVLGFLKNIIPVCLSMTMFASLSFNTILPTLMSTSYGPVTWGIIPGLTLFPHSTSTFLSFILFALKKLNLNKKITLNNDLVAFRHPALKGLAEFLGFRYTTLSFPLILGYSPATVAKQMAIGNALSAFFILLIPSFDVVIGFLEFVAKEAAPLPTAILTAIVLFAAFIGAFLGAESQRAIYEECAKVRQKQLIRNGSLIPTSQNGRSSAIEHNTQEDLIVQSASENIGGPYIIEPSSGNTVQMKMTHFFAQANSDHRTGKLSINLSNI